jgi:quinol monooxygenase YgiN
VEVLDMSVIVVATIVPKEKARDEVITLFRAAIPEVHAEPGCEVYALHESKDSLVMIEKWESAEALRVHGEAKALTELSGKVADKLAAPLDVKTFTALPAGDADKGAV